MKYGHEFPKRIYPGGVDGSKELNRTIAKVKRLISQQHDHYSYELTTEPPR